MQQQQHDVCVDNQQNGSSDEMEKDETMPDITNIDGTFVVEPKDGERWMLIGWRCCMCLGF